MGNKSHSAPISTFMAKSDECKYTEILHPGGLLTGKAHNISSCIEYRSPVKKIRDHPACHSSRRVIKE